MKRYEAIITKQKDKKLGEYKENSLLTQDVLDKISEAHSLTIKEVYKNVYLSYNGKIIEFDVLIKTETPTGQDRWISIELKESDIGKTIEQALIRRDFVDYSYVIINSSVKWIVEYIFYVWHEYIIQEKLGFYSSRENIFVLQSKFKSSDIEIKTDNIQLGSNPYEEKINKLE